MVSRLFYRRHLIFRAAEQIVGTSLPFFQKLYTSLEKKISAWQEIPPATQLLQCAEFGEKAAESLGQDCSIHQTVTNTPVASLPSFLFPLKSLGTGHICVTLISQLSDLVFYIDFDVRIDIPFAMHQATSLNLLVFLYYSYFTSQDIFFLFQCVYIGIYVLYFFPSCIYSNTAKNVLFNVKIAWV